MTRSERQGHDHHHGAVHIDESDWAALAAHTELEGELFLPFVTDTAHWIGDLRGRDAPPVRRVLDIGCGPGVGTCELARQFPNAHVVAVDSSPAMLERVTQRATSHGVDARVRTHLAELSSGLDGLGRADVIWASMVIHHVGNEVVALQVLRERLETGGLVAIAERCESTRVLPDDLDLGRPGLADRLARAGDQWFASMRHGLSDEVPSSDLPSMLVAAGFEVVGDRVARVRVDAPLASDARRFAREQMRRARGQLSEYLDDDDRATLDVLADPDDPRSVAQRPDVFVASARQISIARSAGPR